MTSALHRLEPLAPQWLVTVVAPRSSPTPWAAMIRYALAIGGALVGGVLLGQTALGGLAANGALTASFGDQGGPLPQRLRRIGAGLTAAVVGLVLSRVLLGLPGPLGILLVVAAGIASAYLSAISSTASFAGLQLLVATAVGQGIGATLPLPALLAVYLLGAAWATLLSAVIARLHPEGGGPRTSVLAAFDRLDVLLTALGERGDRRAARIALASALADAWDVITGARAISQGRRDDLHRLSAVIGPLADVAAAATQEPRRLAGARDRLAGVRAVIARAPGGRFRSVAVPGPRTEAALQRLERVAESPVASGAVRPKRRPWAGIAERLLGSRTAVFAARLALCLGVAESLRLVLPIERAYWLLLTVAVVLKPDLGSIFARGVQRTIGTVVGAVVGIVVLLVVPAGPLLLIPVVLIAFGFPLAAARNYGMLSTFVTPLVLILVDLAGGPTRGLATSRLIDTVLAAAVVLLVGYLPWPSTWRPRLGSAVADAVMAMGAYAAVLASPDRGVVSARRRRAFGALQDVRADLQSAFAEPPPRSRVATAWWPVMGQLEQIGDDLRSVRLVGSTSEAERSSEQDAAATAAALHDVAEAMRERRRPAALPLPLDGPLVPAGEDIAALRRLLDGPRNESRSGRAARRARR